MGTTRTESTLIVGSLPIIFWRNIVTATNVDAESDADFPASNVANPSTALEMEARSNQLAGERDRVFPRGYLTERTRSTTWRSPGIISHRKASP